MPQALTVPSWYNDDNYINEKVKECNTIKFGDQSDWNADSVKAALAGAFGEETYAAWMGYENFVSNGNAENCSPSPYFVVAEYLAAKATQLNDIKYEDKTDWDQAKVLDAFKAANISAWDHYTKYGQAEGLNPSNAFDTSSFFEAKCEILNAWENEDGTTGYEGNTDWTPKEVVAVFQGLNINPIMNQPENPDAVSLIIAVPAGEQVSGGSFNPWTPAAPTEYNDIPLVAGEHEFIGTEGNDNFIGDVLSSASKSTLQRDDVIDGNGGDDMLTVEMNSTWQGFSAKGGMSNVETINITNPNAAKNLSFDSTGIKGAETYNITGNVSLKNLAANVDVNLVNTTAATTIAYAAGEVSEKDDALNLGVDNVGRDATVAISANGIEALTVNATGKASNIGLSGVSDMTSLSVTGDANLRIASVDSKLMTIDAEAATGNIYVDATGATSINNLPTAQFGSGDDTLVANSRIAMDAELNGGEGNDTLILDQVNRGTSHFNMTEFEEIQVRASKGDFVISGENTTGLATLTVINTGNNNVELSKYTDNSDITVNSQGLVSGNIEVDEADSVTLKVGDDKQDTTDVFNGALVIPDATTLTVEVLEGAVEGQAVFNGIIRGQNVAEMNIQTDSNQSTFTLQAQNTTNANGQTVLGNVSDLSVSGYGEVRLLEGSNVGNLASTVNVDASNLYATFDANFVGSATPDQTFTITGSSTAKNAIRLGAGIENATINGGSASDTLVIDDNVFTAADHADLTVDLGGGNNLIVVSDPNANDWADLINENTQVVGWNFFAQGSNLNHQDYILADNDASYAINVAGATDLSNIQFADNDQKVTYTATDNTQLTLGQLTTDMSFIGSVPATANHSITYAGNGDGTLFVQTGGTQGVPATTAGTDTLSITNSGTGQLTILPTDITWTASGITRNSALSDVQTLNIDTGSKDAGILLGNSEIQAPSGSMVAETVMTSVANATISGDGNFIVNAQLGKTDATKVVVDASELNGNFIANASITGKQIEVTTGNGNDVVQVGGKWAETAPSTVELGIGQDTLQILAQNVVCTSNDKFASLKVDMGEDSDNDQIHIQYATDGVTSGSSVGGLALSVDNFVVGTDSISTFAEQAPKVGFVTLNTTGFDASWVGAAGAVFGETVNTANVKFTSDNKVAYVENGNGIGDVYMLVAANGGYNSSNGNTGLTLIQLDDVALTGCASWTLATFTDAN